MEELAEKWTSIISTILLSVFGISGHTTFIYLIAKNGQQRFSNPFYALALSLSIPESYRLLHGLILSVPTIINQLRFGPTGFDWDQHESRLPKSYRLVTGYFFTCSWLVTLSHTLSLAVNRTTAVYWPSKYKRFFSHTRCAAILLCSYFYGIFLSSLLLFGECRIEFIQFRWKMVSADNINPFQIQYNDTSPLVWSESHGLCSPIVKSIYYTSSSCLLGLTVIFNLIALIGIWIYRRKLSVRFGGRLPNQQHWSLTAQFTVTTCTMVIAMCLDWTSPSGTWPAILITMSSLCSSAFIPYVYIFLGGMMKTQIFGFTNVDNTRLGGRSGSCGKRQTNGYTSSAC